MDPFSLCERSITRCTLMLWHFPSLTFVGVFIFVHIFGHLDGVCAHQSRQKAYQINNYWHRKQCVFVHWQMTVDNVNGFYAINKHVWHKSDAVYLEGWIRGHMVSSCQFFLNPSSCQFFLNSSSCRWIYPLALNAVWLFIFFWDVILRG